MGDAALVTAIKPFVYVVLLFFIVYPLTWVAWKLIPDGKIKIALFRKRDLLEESRVAAAERERKRQQRNQPASQQSDPSQAIVQSSDDHRP